MNEDLNPLQLLVAQHYANGIYASVKDTNDVAHVDEPLFTRLITEAAECSGPYDYTAQLRRTADDAVRFYCASCGTGHMVPEGLP